MQRVFAALCLMIGTCLTADLPAAEPAAKLFPNTPGLCSYTFRNQFAKDVPGTLDAVIGMVARETL